ncbi:MAG TPA: asparaginase [Pyrinomonadaceae bacterium]|nr:asparaginase [Pyrinomonadaceae bacterium]
MNEINRPSEIPAPAPLVEVRRGSITESRHRGHVIAVDPEGGHLARLGAPECLTFLRSSAKPFQAIPLVTSGAADRYGFTPPELAVACGSHSGEPEHVATVAGMLAKINSEKRALKCGLHEPFSREVARELKAAGRPPDVLQNNCSGKHAGMLALARHLGAPLENYDQPQNPVQLLIVREVERFSGVPSEDVAVGVDGCGVPVFGVTVRAMALMYARLINPPIDFPEEVRAACARLTAAMAAHPEMVGGTSERLDTEIMRATRGAVISKVGAEGVYTAGVLPGERWPRGLGLALKIEDGEDRRARPTVVIESLRQLGVLDAPALDALAPYASFAVKNNRGERVGEIRASFELESPRLE